MATTWYDYNVDPWNSDTPDYIHIQTVEYAGPINDYTTAAAANYPRAASTRLFLPIPFIIDVSALAGARPFELKRVSDSQVMTRVSGAPGSADEYRIPAATSKRRNVIEIYAHADNYAEAFGIDFYSYGTAITEYVMETVLELNGNLLIDGGNIGISADTDLIQLASNSLTINGSIYPTTLISINEGSPDVTQGICINQGGNDDKILTFKSSDVDHGMTDFAEADTFGSFEKVSGNSGGLEITGYGDAQISSLTLNAYSEFSPISDCVVINAGVQNGTTVDPVSDGVIILSIKNDDSFRVKVYGNGKMDVSSGGILTKHASANTGGAPTDAECDTVFGTPAAVEAGFMGLLKDTGGGGVFYLCASTGAAWYTFAGVLAV